MRFRSSFVLVVALVLLVPAGGRAAPLDDLIGCDPIDPAKCLLPFPNDYFTVDDPNTHTGKRINISPLQTPRALRGTKPIFTDELNRNDGFSPGSLVMTFVPGLDLHQTWGETTDHITDIARYRNDDAPILIINARTGRRHAFWSELDTHPQTPPDQRLLLVRPARNFEENTRYLVALRAMKDASGATIPAGPAFTDALAGTGSQAARIGRIVDQIQAAEVGRDNAFDRNELFLAWEFTVASWQNLAGRALHIRNDAFARLGDFDLADENVEGRAPSFTIDQVEQSDDERTAAVVHGSFQVPNYLIQHVQTPDLYDPTRQATTERLSPLYTPHSRFYYPPGHDLPAVNPVQPYFDAKFTCRIPASASSQDPARLILMGHGLLGQRYEVNWNSGNLLTREHNSMYCGTEWVGMALGDLPQAVSILLDPSFFPSLADRSQQGYVNFMYLGRLMRHPLGLASDPSFRDAGGALIDTDNLVYDGNSQGGIMGGALAALAPDYTRATLGVVGMNYSTLLNRSVDWEHAGDVPVGYGDAYYTSIPDKQEQQIGFNLMQMLWDRAEANGYAHHMTDDPYPNTPEHQILLHVAYGDYQVANVSAEVEARTIGARLLQRSMPGARHWSVEPGFGLDEFEVDGGEIQPWNGSALVYWDSGNAVPPNGNIPPEELGSDPHEHPRRDPQSGLQRVLFFDTGWIHDIDTPGAYCTSEFSQHIAGPCPSE